MLSAPWKIILTTLIVVACVKSAAGGEYRDRTGFSFVYPEGWVIVSDVQSVAARSRSPVASEIRTWNQKNGVDLSKAAVFLVHIGHEELAANVNVEVVNQEIRVNDDSVSDYQQMMPRRLASLGVKVSGLKARTRKLGPNEAIVVDQQVIMPYAKPAFRQRLAYIPGGGKTYAVTCTASPDTFAVHEQTFENILANFKVPAPIAQGFDWKRCLSTGMGGAVVGGVAGPAITLLLFRLFLWLKRIAGSRNRAAHAGPPPAAL